MYYLRTILIVVAFLVGAVLSYCVFDPASNLDEARQIILRTYLNAYCKQDKAHSIEYKIGEAALISTLTIKTGIGSIALAEYAKCKVWMQGGKAL